MPSLWKKKELDDDARSAFRFAEVEAHRRVLAGLTELLDRGRAGRDLHLTPVRNEHAYFQNVNEIMRMSEISPMVPSDQAVSPIFIVGDSHVLPAAWRSLQLQGAADSQTHHVLVPCLVTGAKLWHLRPSSKFYTKFCFWEHINNLPNGAPVVFVLGEIDCREGVLGAAQKGRHANIAAALAAVVNLYIDLMREVRKKLPQSPLFLHPVANVLPETRFLTVAFNRMLADGETTKALEKIGARVLDFDPVLKGGHPPADLAAAELAKLELLDELRLDGTHMSPRYVDSHLVPALARAWPEA